MKLAHYLVIPKKGDEPIAVAAQDAFEIADVGKFALIAKTTKEMLNAAGWPNDVIMTVGQLSEFVAGSILLVESAE